MASYPGSVYAPASKNNGDTIQAAHINNAEAEIIAIEDGIRNATAPLNSSNSTVNALSVTNGSTFAGNVVITGKLQSSNSSVNNLVVAGTFTPVRVACALTHSAAQNVPNTTDTALVFDTEESDVGGLHSTASNSSRITFTVAGTYLIGAAAQWSTNTAGTYRQMTLKLNDVTAVPGPISAPSSGPLLQSVTTVYTPASTTEYATVLVTQDSGSTMSISSGTARVRFWAAMVGA